MPDENTNGNEVVEDSIIKEQSVTIATLTDQLSKTGTQPPQIVYTQAEKKETQPNFIIWGVIGFVAWQFLRR